MKTARDHLEELYSNSLFTSPFSDNQSTYKGYIGPFMIDVPNTAERKRIVVYHDLHHLITGYDNSRIGEGEIGAWELGTGLIKYPLPLFLNIGGMSTGVFYSIRRTYSAFMKGTKHKSLYSLNDQDLLAMPYSEVVTFSKKIKPKNSLFNNIRFIFFTICCLLILAASPLAVIFNKWLIK